MSKAEKSTRRGRPPSQQARDAILTAARALLEEVGPARLTVEAVAQRAGVGKPTIYRHWANAQELAMAAIVVPAADIPESPRLADLAPLLSGVVDRLNSKRGRQVALMLAGAEPDGELFKAFANTVVLEARSAAIAALRSGAAEEKLAVINPDTLADMLLGAVFLRLLLRHAPLDQALVDSMLSSIDASTGS